MKTLKGPSLYYLGLIFIIPITYASFTGLYGADIYWHLLIGDDFIFKGLNPFKDHHSIDYLGTQVRHFTLIFDILASIFYALFSGETGLQWLRLSLLIAPFLIVFTKAFKDKPHLLDFLWILSLLTAGIVYRKLVRPEMISYSLLIFYGSYLFKENIRIKDLILLALIQIGWQFSHSTCVFGYIVLAGINLNLFYQEFITNKLKDYKKLGLLSLIGLGTLGIGFLNPSGHILMRFLESDPRWLVWISELRPRTFDKLTLFYQFLFVFSFFTSALCIYFRNFGAFFVMAIFVWQANSVPKLFPHLAILNTTLCFYLFMQLRQTFGSNKAFKYGFNLFLVTTCAGFIAKPIFDLSKEKLLPKPLVPASRLPSDIIDPLVKLKPKGKALNSYMMGGYLAHKLSPDLKIFIDGRTFILFPYEYFEDYLRSARHVGHFLELNKKHNFDYIIGDLTHNNRLIDAALASEKFAFQFVGSHNAWLIPKEKSKYKESSFYFRYPQCLGPKEFKKMLPEIADTYNEQPNYSQLRLFNDMVYKYFNSKDQHQFLKDVLSGPYTYASSLRFAAYRALSLKDFDLAYKLLMKSTEEHKARELILMTELLCKYKKCEGAYPHFIKSVDKIMPNWRKMVLKKQLQNLEKALGKNFGNPKSMAEVQKRLVIEDEPSVTGNRINPCKSIQ